MKDYTIKPIPANYIRGMEGVGGKVVFDNTGLTFYPHAINIQRAEEQIDYCNIKEVKKRNTLGLVPNGIAIVTKDGHEHKFVVYDRSSLIEFLQSKL